jgi:hypothetical protein
MLPTLLAAVTSLATAIGVSVVAQSSDPSLTIDPVRDATIGGLVTVILIGGARGWWVYGRHYEEMRLDRDGWREIARKNALTIREVAEITQESTRVGAATAEALESDATKTAMLDAAVRVVLARIEEDEQRDKDDRKGSRR